MDPNQKQVVGKFAASGALEPDASRGRVFFIRGTFNSTPALQAFDMNTFLPLGSLPVPDSIGGSLLRWGANGVAMQGGASYIFDTSNAGKVFMFRTPMAGAPPAIGSAGGAPGLVAGVMQVNVSVPREITPSDHASVVVVVGPYASADKVTVAVK